MKISTQSQARRRNRSRLLAVAAMGIAVTLTSWSLPEDPPGDDPEFDQARRAMDQLYETRRLISSERADWSMGKELLQDQVMLAKRELESLTKLIAEKRANTDKAQKTVDELQEDARDSSQAYAAMDEMLLDWEARARRLVPRLPGPLRDQVRSLAQSLPAPGQESELERSKRFITVLFLLTQVNKFHGEITLANEVLELPGEQHMEVRTMYLGISQAYYVSSKGGQAGTGQSGERGWDWSPNNDAAGAIARAIAILDNESPADFVPLPVKVQ